MNTVAHRGNTDTETTSQVTRYTTRNVASKLTRRTTVREWEGLRAFAHRDARDTTLSPARRSAPRSILRFPPTDWTVPTLPYSGSFNLCYTFAFFFASHLFSMIILISFQVFRTGREIPLWFLKISHRYIFQFSFSTRISLAYIHVVYIFTSHWKLYIYSLNSIHFAHVESNCLDWTYDGSKDNTLFVYVLNRTIFYICWSSRKSNFMQSIDIFETGWNIEEKIQNPVLDSETSTKLIESRRADSTRGETAGIDSVLPTEGYFLVTLSYI